MSAWLEAQAGNIEYVRKSDFDLPITDEDVERWFTLQNQYIDYFGHSEKYMRYLKIKHKIAGLQIKFLQTGDGFIKNQVKVEEGKLMEIELSMRGGLSVYEAKVHLDKYIGHRINLNEISVYEYHTYLKEYGKANK